MSTWCKTADGYLNLDNGAKLGVSPVQDSLNGVVTYRVHYVARNSTASTLAEGFATEDDARAALNEFAVTLEFVEVQPPVVAEEGTGATPEEEEV